MRPQLAEKSIFNQEETAVFYRLSRRKLFRLLKQEKLPFVVMYNKRKLIDREKFEAYLRFRPELAEELKKGEPPANCKAAKKACGEAIA